MKWISVITLLLIIGWACNNSSDGYTPNDSNNNSTKPDATMTMPPDSSRKGDTSSYDRMPQRMHDSAGR